MRPLDRLQATDGWEALEIDGEVLNQRKAGDAAKAREIASRVHECFRSDAGKFVLDRLIQITLLRPTVTPAASQFEAGIREGRADLVRQILQQIETAENGE
jgi:hypothetical protein